MSSTSIKSFVKILISLGTVGVKYHIFELSINLSLNVKPHFLISSDNSPVTQSYASSVKFGISGSSLSILYLNSCINLF